MLPMKITKRSETMVNSSSEQYDRMLGFMTKNPLIALQGDIIGEGKMFKYNRLWEELTLQLNILGPIMRSVEGWKMVWEEYKKNITKCARKQRLGRNLWKDETENSTEVNSSVNETAKVNLNCDVPVIKEEDNGAYIKPEQPKQRLGRNLWTDETENTIEVNSSVNETATVDLTCDAPVIKEEDNGAYIKTEQPDIFADVTDATNELQLVCNIVVPSPVMVTIPRPISPFSFDKPPTINPPSPIIVDNTIAQPKRSLTFDKSSPTDSQTYQTDQTNLFEEIVQVENQLGKIKRAKIEIARQTSKIKEERLNLKGMLQDLKDETFDLKRQQSKFKEQQMEIKKKELQFQEAARLRNSINNKFKKIF